MSEGLCLFSRFVLSPCWNWDVFALDFGINFYVLGTPPSDYTKEQQLVSEVYDLLSKLYIYSLFFIHGFGEKFIFLQS